jgi:hypothetical protein
VRTNALTFLSIQKQIYAGKVDKFVVKSFGGAYDAPTRGVNRDFRLSARRLLKE